MKLNLGLSMLALVCLSGLALAGPTKKPKHRPDPKRLEAIYAAVRERAQHQHDLWFNDGDFPRAIQSLRLLHELYPKDYALTTDLGWMLENVENNEEALAVYIGYHAEFPNDPEAAYPEGEFYFRNKMWSKVPPIIEPTLKMKEHPHANSYRVLARSYEKLNMFSDSARIWEMYLALSPNDGQAKLNRDRVLKKVRLSMRPTNGVAKRHFA